MRRLLFTSMALLILLILTIENSISAQHRRARTRTRTPAVSNASTIVEIDRGTPEERAKLAEECSTPDRPKPEVEDEEKRHTSCGKAINLPKPDYPPDAKAENIFGTVRVSVVIDEKGRVIWAQAVEGHPLLRQASVKAACHSLHSPMRISGRAVKQVTTISYMFVNQ
ncbi:MAG TPA: TonB family protein [Pyrinomonadaceae bacterium]|nr:TonB family protein [Pyrinomonadaceae bacterium]